MNTQCFIVNFMPNKYSINIKESVHKKSSNNSRKYRESDTS